MKICGACGTENDDTRVFCLNCAKRLPPSIQGSAPGLPVNSTDNIGASAPQIYKHQADKGPAKLRQAGTRFSTILFRILLVLGLFAAGYGAYLTLQPPGEIPNPASAATSEDIARMTDFLRTASQSPGGAWQVDEKSINSFLASAVPLNSEKNLFDTKVGLQRCYVSLAEGRLDFTMQAVVFDQTLYLRIGLAPDTQNEKLGVRVLNASLGQLQVPGFMAQFLLSLWNPCFESLGSALTPLEGAKSAEVSPKRIVVRWPEKSSR